MRRSAFANDTSHWLNVKPTVSPCRLISST
jgi:hypothetical protein